MTNKEIVKWLESLKKEIGKAENRTLWHYAEAIDMAIEALQAKTDGDTISRQDALKPFCVAPDGTRIPEVDCDNFPVEFSVEFIKKHLLSLPSAPDSRQRGKWVFKPKDAIELMFTKPKCSKCGFESADGGNFCSNCGANMGKGQAPIRQHGEWVEIENGVYVCSFCKNQIGALIPPDYCPNCRADMRESDV